jgi:hypothetical protein
MKTIIIFADSLTYPGKEGVSQHVMSLLSALSKANTIRPVLLMCDRGTMSQTQVSNFAWSTILVPHSVYYDYSKMKEVIGLIRPDILQSYSVYHARLISSRYSIENRIPLVMEHHDVDDEFIDNYTLTDKVRNYQFDLIELASLNRTLSFRDARILKKYSPSRSHTFLNIPSTITLAPSGVGRSVKNHDHVLFIGNGAYPPNKSALDFIHEDLAPKLPHVTFHLVGRLTDNYHALRPNIIGYGMVDDISQIMGKVSFGIAPLKKGSGLKIKIMTYLSAGLPVVGTEIAFQGYKDSSVFIKAHLNNFAEVLDWEIDSYNKGLSDSAMAEYLENYHNDINLNKIIDIYNGLKFDAMMNEVNTNIIYYDQANLPWLREFRERKYPVCAVTTYINFGSS